MSPSSFPLPFLGYIGLLHVGRFIFFVSEWEIGLLELTIASRCLSKKDRGRHSRRRFGSRWRKNAKLWWCPALHFLFVPGFYKVTLNSCLSRPFLSVTLYGFLGSSSLSFLPFFPSFFRPLSSNFRLPFLSPSFVFQPRAI